MLILLALQKNSTGSVLIKDGRLGAEIKELKPGIAAPGVIDSAAALNTMALYTGKKNPVCECMGQRTL